MSQDPQKSDDDLTPAQTESEGADVEPGQADDPALQAAMDEAAAAVDRHRSEAEAEDRPDAGEAVTEAIIKAKQELEQALEQTRKEAENFREKWLRAAADLENYRKRAQREREDTLKFGNEKLLRDFLPVLDDLERALEMSVEAAEAQTLRDGMQLVHKKFLGQLEKHGVATFEAVGEPFDPSKHEAIQQSHGELPAGTVMTQLQRGFMLNDRLLRPAMVVVSLGPETSE